MRIFLGKLLKVWTFDFAVGSRLRFCNGEHNEECILLSIVMDEDMPMPQYRIKFDNGYIRVVPKNELFHLYQGDLADIPTSADELMHHAKTLSPADLEALFLSKNPNDALRSEFKYWHDRLGHPSDTTMFSLVEHGYLPKKFLKLKGSKFLCPACIFAKQRRRKWRSRATPGQLKDITPDSDTPGGLVFTDQMISKQPGLVPRQDGRHTRQRIYCVT